MASMANLRALEESYKSKETLEAGPLPSRAPTRIWPGESRSEWRAHGSFAGVGKTAAGGTRRWELPRKNYKSRVETLVEMIHNDIQGQAGSLPSCTTTAPGLAKGGRNGVDG